MIIVILVVAAGVRCAYLPANPYPYDQTIPHAEIARNIIDHGRWFTVNNRAIKLVYDLRSQKHRLINPADVNFTTVDANPQWQPEVGEVVGPGVVLAGVWALAGSERYIYGEILLIVLSTLVVLLVYRIAMLLFKRRRTALIAAALYAVFPPLARQATIFASDIWAIDFTIVVIATYLNAMYSPHRLRWLAFCGLITGLGAYFRPGVLLVPAAFALASLRWVGWRQSLRSAVVVTAIASFLLIPWTIRNYVEFHRFIPTRSGSGQTLWQGLGEIHNNFGALNDDSATYTQVHRVRPDLVSESPEYDSYLGAKAVHAIKGHPLFYAKVVARRMLISTVAMYSSVWMYHGGESPFRYHSRTGRSLLSYVINRPAYLLQSVFEPAIFMFAMLALVFTWRGRAREHTLLVAIVFTVLIPYWILHFEARYALPAAPVYLIWIALGADLLAERVTHRLRVRRIWRTPTTQTAG
jgi:4-amino-4-deoxy-L-arabinose transferase-like glycosyltransferase